MEIKVTLTSDDIDDIIFEHVRKATGYLTGAISIDKLPCGTVVATLNEAAKPVHKKPLEVTEDEDNFLFKIRTGQPI